MKFKIFLRIMLGVGFAFVFVSMANVVSARGGELQNDLSTLTCQACHPIVQEFWQEGKHGTAEVECETCHSAVTNHPDELMPTDVSSRLCGQCHIDTSEEWATSVHGEADLTCSRCHNAHTTEIKADDVHDLCQHCHQERTHSYDLSTHAQQGIQCIECHLPIISDETRLGPGHRVHTFAVNLQSCVACHGDYLHNPEAEPCDPEKILEAQEQGIVYECNENEITQAGLGFPMAENSLMTQPQDVSPFGFTIIGTLAGVAAGMILAPWLEKWFRRNRE